MSPAAEEPREKIKGIVCLVGAAARLLMLLDAVMSVLVIDSAEFWVRDCFVSVCDFDEFLLGGFVAAERMVSCMIAGSRTACL